eukprot:1156510-Pelagomonas_calceolata.AAC.4
MECVPQAHIYIMNAIPGRDDGTMLPTAKLHAWNEESGWPAGASLVLKQEGELSELSELGACMRMRCARQPGLTPWTIPINASRLLLLQGNMVG